jgi:hypothetical protein
MEVNMSRQAPTSGGRGLYMDQTKEEILRQAKRPRSNIDPGAASEPVN